MAERDMKTAYGLDLAGYSTGKATLARASSDATRFSVVIYRNQPFAKKLDGKDPIRAQAEEERKYLRCLRPLYVDVPISLEELRLPAERIYFAWQLTRRPVDFAYTALPPLADRLGSAVARMTYLLNGDYSTLGSGLFETYPAASLIPMIGTVPSYKGQTAERQGGAWIGDDGLADILGRFRVQADDGMVLNDDHFDAAICALTGVLSGDWLLQGAELERDIRSRLERKVRKQDRASLVTTAPKGYVLIRKPLSDLPLHFRFEDDVDPAALVTAPHAP